MQQQCVYFHTEKEPKETENILKKEKMQIVFKAEQVHLQFKDLTEEEKRSWEKFQLEQINLSLEQITVHECKLEEYLEIIKVGIGDLVEFVESCKNNAGNAKEEKAIRQKLKQALKGVRFRELYHFEAIMLHDIPNLFNNDRISCSCIIAKQGENFVRYLRFLANEDPVMTITGPNADSIKSTLEEKF